jgi:hypothetical protein
MRIMSRDRLDHSRACHEQRGLLFFFSLRGVNLLVALLLLAFTGPVPLLTAVATLILCDVAAAFTAATAGASPAVITSVAATTATTATTRAAAAAPSTSTTSLAAA